MTASNLVQFKRGSEASLATLISNKGALDGCFYLTLDSTTVSKTSKLYIGRSDGTAVPVNQGIITVASTAELATQNVQAGDFAYITAGNILAIYSGGAWIQINAQNSVSGMTSSVANADGSATVTITITDAKNNTYPAAFTITPGNGITVTTDGTNKVVTIGSTTYTFTSTAPTSESEGSGSINLVLTGSDSSSKVVSLQAGQFINFSGSTAGSVKINGKDFKISGVTTSNKADGGYGITVTDASNASATGSINPEITYGKNNTESAHFLSNTAALNVYSKTDINDLMRTLDSMTYRGTVGTGGSASTTVGGLTNVQIGDTFKVVENNLSILASQVTSGVSPKLSVGDLLIVTGAKKTDTTYYNTEDASTGYVTNTPVYDYIPAGLDTDTTYTAAVNSSGFLINSSTNNTLMQVSFANGNKTTAVVTGTANNIKTVTYNHNTQAQSDVTSTAETQGDNTSMIINAVTGVTRDSYGHVTGITTKAFTVKDTNLTISSVGNVVVVDSNTATVTTSVTSVTSNGTTSSKSATFGLKSDNLAITATGTVISANMEWGTF